MSLILKVNQEKLLSNMFGIVFFCNQAKNEANFVERT